MPFVALIDDRQTNRTIFSRLATTLGDDVEVLSFDQPLAALDLFRGRTPDLVISDYNMPDMNGSEFTRAFRLLPHCADVPVVIITVHSERDWRLAALNAGATDFLSSPVDQLEFVTRARNLLHLRHHQLLLEKRADKLEDVLMSTRAARDRAGSDANKRLAQVIDALPIMISAVGKDGQMLFSNAYCASIFGARASPAQQTGVALSALDQAVLSTGVPTSPVEEELFDINGHARRFLTRKSPLRDGQGRTTGVLTSGFDIAERQRVEAQLHHVPGRIADCGLPDLQHLMQKMQAVIGRGRRDDQHFAVHVVRLDGFAAVNSLLGHRLEDHFFRVAVERLRQMLRETDVLAQVDGDKLAILQSGLSEACEAQALAKRIQMAVSAVSAIVDDEIITSAAVGIALYPQDGKSAESLLAVANTAMMQAKSCQSPRFCEDIAEDCIT